MITVTTTLEAYTMPDDRDACLKAILAEMTATETSWYQRMYGFTHPDIAAGYLAMHKRGVFVELLLDHTQSVGPHEAAMLHQLIVGGFPADKICITTSAFHEFMHTKEAIVDDEVVIEGSLNFSPTAFKQDNTCLFISSVDLAKDAATRFDNEWAWAKANEAKYQLPA